MKTKNPSPNRSASTLARPVRIKRVKETRKVKSEQIPDQAQEWLPSVVRDENLELLVHRGFLPPKKKLHWRSAFQNLPPSNLDRGETIVYASFFERGLGLPVSKFLRELLNFYNIELVNLTPNGLSHITFFVHMCEAFLGMEPDFRLFRYFFRLKPHPSRENPNICGGAVFQLRQDKRKEYFSVTLKDPKRTWWDEWFIIEDKALQLPECTFRKPVFSDLWNSSLDNEEIDMITDLLTRIKHRKREGLTGVKIAYSFIKRQIQPLQERSELGYKYKGAEDPSRLKKEDLTHDEILERLQIFFGPVNFKGKIPREYSAEYLPEHIASSYCPSPLPEHLTADQTENRVQAAAIREEEARGKRLAHEPDSEEPVCKKRNVEPAHASLPQSEPAAPSTETHPEAKSAETSLTERDQAEAIFKGVMTNYKIFEDGAHQILQTDKDLQKRLQSELDVSLQHIQDLSACLEKCDAIFEQINKVIINGLSSSEIQPFMPVPPLDQIR